MAVDLSELQKRINSILNEDPTEPTQGGSDWNLYLKYLNMAQQEWQESYEWPTLFKEVNTLTSQATGNVTLSLPSDFRKLDGYPKICDESVTAEYPQIDPQKKSRFDSTQKYVYILGYPGSYSLIINPMPGSGASIFYSYWATANSLVSPTDVSYCPDPNYLVYRTTAFLWEARDDGRFTQAKGESDKILARMLENEVTKGHSYDDRVMTREESRSSFVIGRD